MVALSQLPQMPWPRLTLSSPSTRHSPPPQTFKVGSLTMVALDLGVDSSEHSESPRPLLVLSNMLLLKRETSRIHSRIKCNHTDHPAPPWKVHVQQLTNQGSALQSLGQALWFWKGSKVVIGFHIPCYTLPYITVLFF